MSFRIPIASTFLLTIMYIGRHQRERERMCKKASLFVNLLEALTRVESMEQKIFVGVDSYYQ